jgi:hypothetical protein
MRWFWARKASITYLLRFIEVPVPSQENERSCNCFRGIILPLSTIFFLEYFHFSDSFILLYNIKNIDIEFSAYNTF